MSAEGQLYNAALFTPAQGSTLSSSKTPLSAVKGHLFKLMRPALSRETDLRERLGKIKNTEGAIDAYIEIVEEMKERMKVSAPYHKFLTIINPAS